MNALSLFLSSYCLVFFLGLQSLNVNNGHKKAAFITSFGIGISHMVLYKLAPHASFIEVVAFLLGGPFGIITSMKLHPIITKYFKR